MPAAPEFTPGFDAFPTPDVFKQGDHVLDDKFKDLAQALLGDSADEDGMEKLVFRFKEAIKEEGLIVPDYAHFYRKVLRSAELNVEKSIVMLKEYIKQVAGSPIDYKDLLPMDKMDKVYKEMRLACMPYRDQRGQRIVINRIGTWNPDIYSLHELFLAVYMICEMISIEPKTQVAGVTLIIEGEGFGFKQFRNITVGGITNLVNFIQERFPIDCKNIFLINTPRLFNVVFNTMVKPLLSAKMKDRMITLGSNEELHKYVSPEVLPDRLGGKLGPIDNAVCLHSMRELEGYYKEVQKMGEDNKGKVQKKPYYLRESRREWSRLSAVSAGAESERRERLSNGLRQDTQRVSVLTDSSEVRPEIMH